MSAPGRLIVFIDYQNAYMSARETFVDRSSHYTRGQIDPWALGETIMKLDDEARKDGETSVLHQVRLYCGLPDSRKDAVGNAARLRQIRSWGRMPGVVVSYRPLRYPREYPVQPPQEKGVDVQLAVDVIRMALQGEYDTGVIFSRDTDLRPLLETMSDLYPKTGINCHVATWQDDAGTRRGLRVPGKGIWCHYIGRHAFNSVEDLTDYRHGSASEVLPSWR